jgi:hypothetical protein
VERQRRSFNPKRHIVDNADPNELKALARQVGYGGNPEHKRNPGDFGLSPPASPRRDKTLCDGVGVFERETALRLLRKGIRKGLISAQRTGSYPQNVWAVTQEGTPVEAQLENREQGLYHGYPMPASDPLRDEVLRRWKVT